MDTQNTSRQFRYLEEVRIPLHRAGFETLPLEGEQLPVLWNGAPLCRITGKGSVFYRREDADTPQAEDALYRVEDIAAKTLEYMTAMEAAPQLKASGLDGDYRILADFGGTVLAGSPSKYGVQFVTWDWDYDRTGVVHGHYFMENYDGAKQDFATRSGLIQKEQLFSPEQLTEIFRCCADSVDEDFFELTLTHKNLPLAIFLEEADLGYAAWSGSRTEKASNGDIISSLGIGIVRFNEVTTPPEINDFDYEYRVNTEVITSVEVRGGQSDPDNPVSVRFNIQGRTYTVSNDYYPDGDSQLAWVRWRTPAEPCVITISVSVSGSGSAQGTIICNIVDLDGNDPPNPLADDRNDAFRLSSIPEKEQVTSASWGIWSPWWQENWEWVENWQKCWHTDRWTDADGKTRTDRWYHWVDNGWWEDHGWWEFDYNGYSASLAGSMKITPDEKSPTATASALKSGYGVQEKVTAKVTTNQSTAVTAAQNAVTYFPEFGYENYWRLLEAEISGRSTTFQFKANPYSTYNRRTHFTPIWYPDGSYTPYTWLLDCWTPAGMLSMNLTDSVTIRGNLWEEWHIAPAKQR